MRSGMTDSSLTPPRQSVPAVWSDVVACTVYTPRPYASSSDSELMREVPLIILVVAITYSVGAVGTEREVYIHNKNKNSHHLWVL